MKKRMLICMTVIFLIIILQAAAQAAPEEWLSGEGEVYNSQGEHFCYEIQDGHAVLTLYWVERDKAQPAVVRVPAEVGGTPLTAVGWCAFDSWDVFDLPDGKHQAYDSKKVEQILIPEGVTALLDGALVETESVQAISLPSSLSEIETDFGFEHVWAEISFPNGNPHYRMENGFLIDSRSESLIYCNRSAASQPLPKVRRIETRALANYIGEDGVLDFPDGVEYIGGYNAFDRIDLETIIIPGSVKEIGDYGLFCNSATNIVLNEGLEKIGAFAFSETEAGEISVPSTVQWIGYGAFLWEGLEPIVQNENCIWETEAQYKSREWTESTRNDEVLYVSDEWPLRKAEIVRDEDGRDFLRITMRDGSGLMFVSTALPEGTTLQEDLAGDTTLLLSCPAENADDPEKAGEAEKISLTFILGEDDWYLVFATDNKEWAAEVQDGVWLFDDFETPGNGGEWQTESEDRLTEFCFDDLTEMAEAYRQRLQMK